MPMPPLSTYSAAHFHWRVADRVGFVELNRPERKNPLTFDSYAELRDLFRALVYDREVRAVVFSGAGGNFCSGGDVHEIIGPLTGMAMPELLDFTRMTGDLVRAIRACPQVVIAAVDGVCAGAGAIIAMASDMRLATQERADCVFVHPRRARRLRHGRMRHPAAAHRPGTGRRIAVHGTGDDGRGGLGLGFLRPIARIRSAARRGADDGEAVCVRSRCLRTP